MFYEVQHTNFGMVTAILMKKTHKIWYGYSYFNVEDMFNEVQHTKIGMVTATSM